MNKQTNLKDLFNKMNNKIKRQRANLRLHKLIILILFVVIGVQYNMMNEVKTQLDDKNKTVYVGTGTIEKVGDHMFRIMDDEELAEYEITKLPSLPANLK